MHITIYEQQTLFTYFSVLRSSVLFVHCVLLPFVAMANHVKDATTTTNAFELVLLKDLLFIRIRIEMCACVCA